MKMMKINWLLTSSFFVFFTLLSSTIGAKNHPSPDNDREAAEKAVKLENIQARVEVLSVKIKDLRQDKKVAATKTEKAAIRSEKKRLRTELKALEAEARAVSGGIYIGSGALILIIILLLLL
jgi:hypothetical protein